MTSTLPADVPATDPVVVVGAGLSGLVAAHLLQAQGVPVRLIEARDRLGGRIHGVAPGLDLGPAWVWPDANPRLAHWVQRLGLTLFEQHSQGAALLERPAQPLQRHALGFQQEPPSMRVRGGMTALVQALRAGLDERRVHTGTRLLALSLPDADAGDAPAVELELLAGGQVQRRRARRVLLALPPRVLAAGVRWLPPLPAATPARWAATPTWMAGQAKLLAVYATPFWRARGFSGMAISRVGPLAEVHDACDADGGVAALFGFVGVPAALRQRVGDAALTQAALQQLVRLFGAEAETPLALHLQDWATEPETATEADAPGGEGHPSPPPAELPAPWCGLVRLAGTEFAADFSGYLEGAVLAGERAAAEWLVLR